MSTTGLYAVIVLKMKKHDASIFFLVSVIIVLAIICTQLTLANLNIKERMIIIDKLITEKSRNGRSDTRAAMPSMQFNQNNSTNRE